MFVKHTSMSPLKTSTKFNNTRKRYSSATQHDLELILNQKPHDVRPKHLKTLKLIGVGATTDVYRKGDKVFKYNIRKPTVTRFTTSEKVLKKLEALKLVIPEVRINDSLYSTTYCESCFPNSAFQTVRCNLILTLMADALAHHDIYGMDLQVRNIGRCPSDGQYYIVDNDGFFQTVSSKKNPNASMWTLVGATVNRFRVPHAIECKWDSIFDASHEWYYDGETTEWALGMSAYKKHMSAVKTVADIRLRNFVSHYLLFGGHIGFGLCLLPITTVYARATKPTQTAVDTFLHQYYNNRVVSYLNISSIQNMVYKFCEPSKRVPWLLDEKRRRTFPKQIDQFAKAMVKLPMYVVVVVSYENEAKKTSLWSRVKRYGPFVMQVSVLCGAMIIVAHEHINDIKKKNELRRLRKEYDTPKFVFLKS